jgi:sugar transferase (PEP-CTERM/EpsH1 system associated)
LLRALFLSHRLPYAPNRGDRIRAYHLLKLLAAHHDVHVVSLVHDKAEAAEVSGLASWVTSADGAPVSKRVQMAAAALALPTSRPLTHVLLHSSRVRALVDSLSAQYRFDIVIAYGSAMARYALEPPLDRLPCLLDMIDVDSEKWAALADTAGMPMRWIYRREARLLRRFEQLAADRACATIVVNEREQRLLLEVVGHAGGLAIPNGVDLEWFRPDGPPSDRPQVVFCGVFNYAPNEQGAVWLGSEVWPRVLSVRPDAKLVLVGAEPSQTVRALARDASITVTGTVADVRPYLWQSAVAAAPLKLARGVQNKVLEALSAGLPCVVTPPVFEGLPEAVRPACLAASETQRFADHLLSLLNQPADRRRALSKAANLTGLGWSEQLRPFLDVVKACAGGGAAPVD